MRTSLVLLGLTAFFAACDFDTLLAERCAEGGCDGGMGGGSAGGGSAGGGSAGGGSAGGGSVGGGSAGGGSAGGGSAGGGSAGGGSAGGGSAGGGTGASAGGGTGASAGGGTGGGTACSAPKLQLLSAAQNLNAGGCQSLTLQFLCADGSPAQTTQTSTVNLTATGVSGVGTFYRDPICSSTVVGGGLQVAANTSTVDLSFQSVTPGMADFTLGHFALTASDPSAQFAPSPELALNLRARLRANVTGTLQVPTGTCVAIPGLSLVDIMAGNTRIRLPSDLYFDGNLPSRTVDFCGPAQLGVSVPLPTDSVTIKAVAGIDMNETWRIPLNLAAALSDLIDVEPFSVRRCQSAGNVPTSLSCCGSYIQGITGYDCR